MNTLSLIQKLILIVSVFLFSCCTQLVYEFQPNVNQGGRAISFAVKPGNNNEILVASESGGIFRTTDGGQKWEHMKGFGSMYSRDLAYVPNNPNIVIATTEGRFRTDETCIWRSADGGISWKIPVGSRMPAGSRCPEVIAAHGIAFSKTSNRLFVGTDCGLAISDDLGETWIHKQLDPTRGIYGDKRQNCIFSLLTLESGRILAAGEDGVWRSDDDGNTWQRARTGPNQLKNGIIHGLASSPYSSDQIFMAYRVKIGGTDYSKLYLSTDGGVNWTEAYSVERAWGRPLFVQTVKIAIPQNERFFKVYFGEGVKVRSAVFKHHASAPRLVHDWEKVSDNHADPSEFAIHSDGINPMMLATDGGIHKISPYLFLLKEGNGHVHIHNLDRKGKVGDEIQRHDWTGGWSSLSFYETAGRTYLLMLKKSNGNVHVHKMNLDGKVGTRTDTRDWSNGWTQAVPFKVQNTPYLFLLKEESGIVHIHKLDSDGTIGAKLQDHDWSRGWTNVSFYESAGQTFLLMLKEGDGTVHVHRMNANGTVGARTDTRDWSSGWTEAVPYYVGGNPFLFLLKHDGGIVHIHSLNADGTIGEQIDGHDWSNDWSTVSFFYSEGKSYLFMLKESDGKVHVHEMNDDGTVGSRTDTHDWTSGWTQAVPYPRGKWYLTGPNGYSALQITEMTGQEILGEDAHLDLYYATQDNSIKASNNGGVSWDFGKFPEGFFLRIPPKSQGHNHSKLTGVSCGPCGNFITDQHLENSQGWPNPPDEDSIPGDVDGNPFLLPTPGHYIQKAINHDQLPLDYSFKLTTDYGQNWDYSFSVSPKPVYRPFITGTNNNPYIYQTVELPGLTSDGVRRIGLRKITGIYDATGPTVKDADVNGLESIGVFPTMFAHYPVYAANPFVPNRLICADVGANEMKYSNDGGLNWFVDQELTDMVMHGGNWRFNKKKFSLASAIAFDPYANCHILVATAQNGIFRSTNGGRDWKYIKGSKKVTNVSSFYFPSEGKRIYVSTYGRGLWTLKLKRPSSIACSRVQIEPIIPELPSIHDYVSGKRSQFEWPPAQTRWKDSLNYIVVKHGQIQDLKFDGNKLVEIGMNSGFINQYNSDGKKVELQIPNNFISGDKKERLRSLQKMLPNSMDPKTPIRGLLIKDGQLVGFIASKQDLPIDIGVLPQVEVHTRFSVAGVPLIQDEEDILVIGSGFLPGYERTSKILLLDREIVRMGIGADSKGNFRLPLSSKALEGQQTLVVEQRQGNKLIRIETEVLFAPNDVFDEIGKEE